MKAENVIAPSRSSWSVAEVAKRNALSKQFVRIEIACGRLKAKRMGRRVLVPVAAELEWLASAPEK